MLHSFKYLLAVAVIAGAAAAPGIAHAQSAQPKSTNAKSDSVSEAKKSQASTDEFEENRRAHMQKSKENNANKGEN